MSRKEQGTRQMKQCLSGLTSRVCPSLLSPPPGSGPHHLSAEVPQSLPGRHFAPSRSAQRPEWACDPLSFEASRGFLLPVELSSLSASDSSARLRFPIQSLITPDPGHTRPSPRRGPQHLRVGCSVRLEGAPCPTWGIPAPSSPGSNVALSGRISPT